jgi:hypothetical protein
MKNPDRRSSRQDEKREYTLEHRRLKLTSLPFSFTLYFIFEHQDFLDGGEGSNS